MKKNWSNPEVKNLALQATEMEEACPYEEEAKSEPVTTSLFPEIVWGDGKLGCTHWSWALKGCTNPNYGKKGTCWPCPQAPKNCSQG